MESAPHEPSLAAQWEEEKIHEESPRFPAWLLSLVVHLLVLLVLALIPLRHVGRGALHLILRGTDSGELGEFALAESGGPEMEQLTSELAQFDSPSTFQPDRQPVDLSELIDLGDQAMALATPSVPSGILRGLSGRSGSLKGALLAKFGGSKETEDAVELGLKWLDRQQRSDGSWSLKGPYLNGGVSENTTAATAMALNAFLGAGYTQVEGKYREPVLLGLKYLVRRQNDEGFFASREPSRQRMYAQAIASIAVAEAYGMTSEDWLREPAQRAMRFAAWSQSSLHGWRYNPREDADLSVTGWFVMALQTGRMAGLEVDEEKLNKVSRFLDTVSHDEQSRYAYTEIEPPSLSMTAEGLLCRIYLGWPRSHPALTRAIVDDLLPTRPSTSDEEFSVYYWYYATQVVHHYGGKAWEAWNDAMKKTLPALQEKSGAEAGSWDPSRDIFGAAGGRLYTTCLHIYCLEVYYRHLAIYDVAE
ncbi:MAG: hypothetical protein KatS3mg111_3298 [Pirellulaceae bacterium]|nr:MAG: hypothetical protein KatS3mg111_3298 [Pirellulaceae bacterium]